MNRPEQLVPHGRVLRYNFRERAWHWVVGFSYIYLLLTGLAFWSPWLFWIAVILGGGPVSRLLHPWFGLVFAAGIAQMYRMWSSQMHFEEVDRAWMQSMNHYVRNEDEKMPAAGRYNAGQKMLFWGFLICMVLMVITGVIMWFPEYVPSNLVFILGVAVFVHASSAMLTIGLFLIHVYMGVFAERGAFGSVIRGDVSLEFAKRYHPGWYEEIVGRSSSTSAPRK